MLRLYTYDDTPIWNIQIRNSNKMVQLTCPIEGCSYVTVDGSEVIACALLAAHTPAHTIASAPMTSGPKLDRPKIDIGVTLEQWNIV